MGSFSVSIIGKAMLWLVCVVLAALAISSILAPIVSAYVFYDWRWAALTAVGWLGLLVFLGRFGPYLLGRYLARVMEKEVEAAADDLAKEVDDGAE